jgi:hypothetical protein
MRHYYESFESACTDISRLKAVDGITVVCTKKVKINVNENEFDFNIE